MTAIETLAASVDAADTKIEAVADGIIQARKDIEALKALLAQNPNSDAAVLAQAAKLDATVADVESKLNPTPPTPVVLPPAAT